MSEIEELAGVVPSEAARESLFRASLLASGGLLAIFGIPWLVTVLTWRSPVCVCLCVPISPFYDKYTRHIGLEAHPNPVRSYFF